MSTIEEIQKALERDGDEDFFGVFAVMSQGDNQVPVMIEGIGRNQDGTYIVCGGDYWYPGLGYSFDLACEDCFYDQPCYEHDESYRLFCDEQDAINSGLATELRHCYLCEPDVNKRLEKDAGPLRGVARHSTQRTHPTHPEADVYDVVHMIPCGHALI